MIESLKKAIVDRAKAAGFWGTVGGRMSFTEAPQDERYPYCVFRFSGIDRDEIMGDKDDGILLVSTEFIMAVEADDGGAGIADLYQELRDSFDWCTLSIDDHSFIACSPVSTLPIQHDNGIWQMMCIYEISFEKE